MVSTRRNKKNPYAVGDKVEVTRRGAVVEGILLSKHKRQRNNTQWKISLGDASNIVVKESKLGRIVSLTTTTDDHPPLPAATVSGSDVSITTTQQLSQSSSSNTAKPARSKTISRKELQQAGLTTRQGQTVRKIPMQTGILYIYTKTRKAEFVRTK